MHLQFLTLAIAALSSAFVHADDNKQKANGAITPKTEGETPAGKPYVYKTSAGVERNMEIYFPPNNNPATAKVPGLILFHGGGWQGGSLQKLRYACEYFASRGIVCATAEYQMLGKKGLAQLPAGHSIKRVCVTDAKSAIRWFKQNSTSLGIDPTRIITGGGSAGAHISALATMNSGLSDPTDPADVDTHVAAYLWFNPAFTAQDKKDPEIDVLHHLKADLPPTFVIFGDKDEWRAGWDTAHAKWQSLGVKSIDLLIAPNQKHGFFNYEPWKTSCLIAADEFLTKNGFLTGEPTLPVPQPEHRLQVTPPAK